MANQWAMERAFYDIFERDQRIAALEAQVARLTAEVSRDEAADIAGTRDFDMVDEVQRALTAFLERRMKG